MRGRGWRWLEGVTETPLFLPDGSILERPGFDRRSGLLYIPEIRFPRVPENPSRDDATGAANTLFGLVADFPFRGPEHKSAWLAALLTPFVRATLPGLAPLFVFDSNAAGSGKTMLCDIISIIGTGRCVGRTGYPATDEEMDKVTLALALGGTKMVLFDNQATGSPIGGAALDAVLTATTRSGRILGLSRFVTDVPFHATIFCTGNNVALKGDTLRRVVLCRLESPLERPEERDNFAVANLLADVRERRGDLAVAALTILRAYHVAGRPVPDPKPTPMGGFEAWANLVRRAVHWVSDHDPCATKSEAKAADRTATQLPALIEGWAALCRSVGAEALSTAQALQALEESPGVHADLRTLLAESTKDGRLPSPQGLGNMLGRVRGRPVAGRGSTGPRSTASIAGSCARPCPRRRPRSSPEAPGRSVPGQGRGGPGGPGGPTFGRPAETPERAYSNQDGALTVQTLETFPPVRGNRVRPVCPVRPGPLFRGPRFVLPAEAPPLAVRVALLRTETRHRNGVVRGPLRTVVVRAGPRLPTPAPGRYGAAARACRKFRSQRDRRRDAGATGQGKPPNKHTHSRGPTGGPGTPPRRPTAHPDGEQAINHTHSRAGGPGPSPGPVCGGPVPVPHRETAPTGRRLAGRADLALPKPRRPCHTQPLFYEE